MSQKEESWGLINSDAVIVLYQKLVKECGDDADAALIYSFTADEVANQVINFLKKHDKFKQ